MRKDYKFRDNLYKKYAEAINYVSKHNKQGEWEPDIFVCFEMIRAVVFNNAPYEVPADLDKEEFKKDYEEFIEISKKFQR